MTTFAQRIFAGGKCRQSVIMSRLQCSESVTSSNLTITIIDTVYKVTVNSIEVHKCHFDKHGELVW